MCGLSLPSGGFHPREESDDSKIRLLSLNPQVCPLEWLGTPWAGLCRGLQKWQDRQSLQREERPPPLRTWVVKGSAHNSHVGGGIPASPRSPGTPAGCPTVHLHPETVRLETGSDPKQQRVSPCPDFTRQSQVRTVPWASDPMATNGRVPRPFSWGLSSPTRD